MVNLSQLDLSVPEAKSHLRWRGPSFGYGVIDIKEFTAKLCCVFLLAQIPQLPRGLLITILISKQIRTLAYVLRQQDRPDIPKPDLKEIATIYFKYPLEQLTRQGNVPVLEKVFRIPNDKELVLTLSEDSFSDLTTTESPYVWTLWLSFRRPANRSITDMVLETISEDKDLREFAAW